MAYVYLLVLFYVFLSDKFTSVQCMRLHRPWTAQHWCDSVIDTHWPFEYEKQDVSALQSQTHFAESKGRVNTNVKNMGHICTVRGVQSKCHRCEVIPCGENLEKTCNYQIQGLGNGRLAKNIASVSDTPWAVNGRHRNDFGDSQTSHVCVMLSGGDCIKPPESTSVNSFDYRSCVARCWGHLPNPAQPVPFIYSTQTPDPMFLRSETVAWEYNMKTYHPQGATTVLLGQPLVPGFQDGQAKQALFRNPSAVAVDEMGNVFVADTGNHCIRRYSVSTGIVTTIAGVPGKAGFKDGDGKEAMFDSPKGITLYYDWGAKYESYTNFQISEGVGQLIVVISDTNNHRIRQIKWPEDDNIDSVQVTTLAGRRTHEPEAGFADGHAIEARFNFPHGIAADDDGAVFVADTFNHLIRRVLPNGDVFTLAGHLEPIDVKETKKDGDPSCRPPCLEGISGYRDGNLSSAEFMFPSDVTIAENNTIMVADGHRVRRVTRNGTNVIIDGVSLYNQVVTVAGQTSHGKIDGIDKEATFNKPSGIAMTHDGRVYIADTVSCRIRRVSSAKNVARPISCSNSLLHIIRPSGCASYEPPVDAQDLKATDVSGNIHYNFNNRTFSGKLEGWKMANTSYYGRQIRRCQGSPPPRLGITSNGNTLGPNADTDFDIFEFDEDTGQGTAIYVQCSSNCLASTAEIYGTGIYTDDSSICLAAIHAGVITNEGGLVKVIIEPGQTSVYQSTSANSVLSLERTGGWHRGFSVTVFPITERQVQTIAGIPAALLDSPCGFNHDEEETLPQTSKFNLPQGVAVQKNKSLATDTFVYISDTGNHVIRVMTATCAMVCENGGSCVGPELCSCPTGWSGDDCTIPVCDDDCASAGLKSMCVAPNTCGCIPGYTNFPSCNQALCVQTCEHGGTCIAPDTCACASGWFDTNCTTPVCSQTCGNGGNCTGPDICTCPSDWTGVDCRTPVCRQTCHNGGICVAPDSCACTAKWSGHDCSLPICTQGYLVTEDKDKPASYQYYETSRKQRIADSTSRPLAQVGAYTAEEAAGRTWLQYMPCNLTNWCDITNDFDCQQPDRKTDDIEFTNSVFRGEAWRYITGYDNTFRNDSNFNDYCERIELATNARTPYSYEYAENEEKITPPWRFQPPLPYAWDAFSPGPNTLDDWNAGVRGWRASSSATSDRIIAQVQWRKVPQGVYVCANNGNCTAPDTCVCAPGWIGFDCRIPVCEQGYFEPNVGNGKVLFEGGNLVAEDYPGQGKYECSIRSVTEWENNEYIQDHPNYYSRYMDHHDYEWGPGTRYQLEPETPQYWDAMGWPASHTHTEPDGNHTQRGWTREGYWERNHQHIWKKGKCKVEYERVCPGDETKSLDVRRLVRNTLVADTDSAFRAVTIHVDQNTRAIGRWHELGGECIDHVHRGCYNNGTCVAPNTCKCAPGWTGSDCSIPVCTQTCSRSDDEDLGRDNNNLTIFSRGKGNCTLPDTCTCEKGWEGHDCSIPLCAQECNNGGVCTAPDTCSCARWYSTWRDNRINGGRPLFRTDIGKPQLTGWTGYDCSTPICVQSKTFTYNQKSVGATRLGGYGLILYGQEPYNNLRREDIRFPPYEPFTWTEDFPPVKEFLTSLREFNKLIWAANGDNMLEYRHMLCRKFGYGYCVLNPNAEPYPPTWGLNDGEVVRNDGRSFQSGCKYESGRFSDYDNREGIKQVGYLCEVDEWEQGDYDHGRYIRTSGDATRYYMGPNEAEFNWLFDTSASPGEGIYECENYGSCVAPDKCSCPDGYTDYDCSKPLCRHRQVTGEVVSCQNEGVCVEKDQCKCKQTMSILHLEYPDIPRVLTGWNGSDCSIPMCAQADHYDPLCDGVTLGGEGCFRCKNGGNCTAPDFCTCPANWTGIDCGTPVCTIRADERMIEELHTYDTVKIQAFELDPCQTEKKTEWNGQLFGQGNCTYPGVCTCLCKNRAYLIEGEYEELPWQDPLGRQIPVGTTFGTLNCISGYEGKKHFATGLFETCHLVIYEPTWFERKTVLFITLIVFGAIGCGIGYVIMKRRIRQAYLLAKAARRREDDDEPGGKKKRRKKRKQITGKEKGKKKKGNKNKKKRQTKRKAG